VHESIEDSEDRGKTGGPAYLGSMAQNTPSALNIRRYAELVRDRSVQRRLAHVATEIAETALTPGGQDVRQMLDEAESKIFQIAEAGARRGEGPVEAKPLLAKVFEQIDHLYHRDNPSRRHRRADGLHAARPEDRRPAAGGPDHHRRAPEHGEDRSRAEHRRARRRRQRPARVVFSMEMSGTQLMSRMLASISHVDSHKLRTGRLNDNEWGALSEGMSKLHEVPLYIDEAGALTAMEVRARARRLKRQHSKLGLIVIDYLQLMEGRRRR
jgi:replicative DNA helicase